MTVPSQSTTATGTMATPSADQVAPDPAALRPSDHVSVAIDGVDVVVHSVTKYPRLSTLHSR